ncbi:ribosome maturation protein [Parasitella parasitica]|nr:ribosome maturation protein [Parasitella parasitica]
MSSSDKATKVVYKAADNTEFFVIANEGMVSKWKKDTTIPLIDVVQKLDVYTSATGSNTGEPIHPSNGALESAFNTTNKNDIVKKIISEGEEKGF